MIALRARVWRRGAFSQNWMYLTKYTIGIPVAHSATLQQLQVHLQPTTRPLFVRLGSLPSIVVMAFVSAPYECGRNPPVVTSADVSCDWQPVISTALSLGSSSYSPWSTWKGIEAGSVPGLSS